MSEQILKQLSSINMKNFLVFLICIVWAFAQVKSISTNTDFTPQAQNTLKGLEVIMTMILGSYLRQMVAKSSQKSLDSEM